LEYRKLGKLINAGGRKKYYHTLEPGSSFITKINPSLANKNYVVVTMKTGSTYTGELNSRNERHGYGIY